MEQIEKQKPEKTSKPKMTVGEIREKLSQRFESFRFSRVALIMMVEAIEEFPENTQEIIKKVKKVGEGSLDGNEIKLFHQAKTEFWRKIFGVSFDDTTTEAAEEIKSEKIAELEKLKSQKTRKMEILQRTLKNLDEGEIVEAFADETRRIVYFDEDSSRYFVEENGKTRYLDVADVLSDYAWGIKYVPDGEMTEPAYRRITKRILINEARRDLEDLYNFELTLIKKFPFSPRDGSALINSWLEGKKEPGLIAEIIVRELLARTASTKKLDFIVERANVKEDHIFKYDFKIRSLIKIRGVGVGDGKNISNRLLRVGIQLATGKRSSGKKVTVVERMRAEATKGKLPVDDLVFLKIRTAEFTEALERWLTEGKPLGGPEQFLSEELKAKLIWAVTEKLFKKTEKGAIYIKQV